MELDAVQVARAVLESRHRRLGRRRQRGEPRRRLEHGVAVTHPAGLLDGKPAQQPSGLVHVQPRAAELADRGALHAPAELEDQGLHPVTDPEHGHAELEELHAEARRALGVHGRRAAGEDQPARQAAANLVERDVVRQQLREDAALAHPARDELRVLAAEVEHQHLVDTGPLGGALLQGGGAADDRLDH
jgi:hypothetical protein